MATETNPNTPNSECVVAKYTNLAKRNVARTARKIVDLLSTRSPEYPLVPTVHFTNASEKGQTFEIAYPVRMFDDGDVCQWFNLLIAPASACGARLLGASFPKGIRAGFIGPKFGSRGVMEIIGFAQSAQPLLCYMLNSTVGWSPELAGQIAYHACLGGANIFTDDEISYGEKVSKLEARASAIAEGIDRAEQAIGARCIYAANVSSGYPTLSERADVALDNGASGLMVNCVPPALSAVAALAGDPTLNVPIYSHSLSLLGDGCSTEPFGSAALCSFLRMAGADLVLAGKGRSIERTALIALTSHDDEDPQLLPSVPVVSKVANRRSVRSLIGRAHGCLAVLIKQAGSSSESTRDRLSAVSRTLRRSGSR